MVPKTHPRYISLSIRDKLVSGVKKGTTSSHGLLAHGRGEAFDYILGEKTRPAARKQIKRAAVMLKRAKHPVISVNGNAAALVPKELVQLSKVLGAPLEVNIFHASKVRERKIAAWLKKNGAKSVLLPGKGRIKYIESNRKYCHEEGIAKADVVFVPLEDGDRAEALVKMGKKVITVDLNARSRTARFATVCIVDNICRAMPLLIKNMRQN